MDDLDRKIAAFHAKVYATCKFRPGAVDCDTPGGCWHCGWCPRVERQRSAKRREAEAKEKWLLGNGPYKKETE